MHFYAIILTGDYMVFSRADFMTESKLAILYLLDKNGVRMTFEQILECMSGNDLMNYFDIKEALAELSEKGLIYTHDENGGTLYSSSLSGRIHLSEFRARI
ncbi:MAG TPA: DUF4364 family protein, partial [Clostridia bacterium]|nr:DUF4364 family protein [Clostridia bacterium]